MKFKNLGTYFGDLINCEGSILTLVENEDQDEVTNERLYLSGICANGTVKVYCKVNDIALLWYFQGRIKTKELFLMRNDETYYVEKNGKLTTHHYSEEFKSKVLDTLECGELLYPLIDSNCKLENPFTEVLNIVKRDWYNSYGAVFSGEYDSQKANTMEL